MAFSLAATASPVRADEVTAEKEVRQFTRLSRDDDGAPVALEAAIVRFAPVDRGKDGPIVDLVSALHVAEGAYYEALNRRFEEYDVVLYELVAPEGTVVPKGGVPRGSSPVSMLQTTMTDVLKLEFQLNGIDYTVDNFIHADMTPKQFAESMQQRGESVLKTFFRMLGHAMSKQESTGAGSDLRLFLALFQKDRSMALKRVLAEEFQNMEGTLTALNGPDGSTLVTERNKVALEVLRKQIDAGHKKLAIFYGAGHMPDFEERLREDFTLAPLETTWITAWNLKGGEEADGGSDEESRVEASEGKTDGLPESGAAASGRK